MTVKASEVKTGAPHGTHRSSLISVIIPAFNYARFLRQTLDSALNQAGVPLEVLVVDDGSTDETPDVLAGYGSDINVIRQKHQGLSAARNAGLNGTGGTFIVFLDADDVLPRGALASQSESLLADTDADAVVCQSFFFETCDTKGALIKSGKWRLFKDHLDVHLCHFNIAPPHAFMFKRSALNRAGLFDTSLKACEDHDMWFRTVFNGAKLKINPDLEVPYRRHPGSVSQNVETQWLHDAKLHYRIADALKESDFPLKRRAEGLLGCVAGCLFTANRLEETYLEVAGGLRRQARKIVRHLPSIKEDIRGSSLVGEFFGLRIAMHLNDALNRDDAWAKDMVTCMKKYHDARFGALLELSRQDIEALVEQRMKMMTGEDAHQQDSQGQFGSLRRTVFP